MIGVQGMVVAEWRVDLRRVVGCWWRWREGREVGADRAAAATSDLEALRLSGATEKAVVILSASLGRVAGSAKTFER